MNQISFFDGTQPFRNNKPIRLIELFAGYGSQALALKYLGVPFEHHRISEWATKSIQAYKDIHAAADRTDYSEELTVDEIKAWLVGKISLDYNEPATEEQIKRFSKKTARTIYNAMRATRNIGSITQATASDLAIERTNEFLYIMTYSFPCQDLSPAGNGAGMSKGSGTRSGLLWEVERLLGECRELPQVLLMENVPQVVGSKAIADFVKWRGCLERLGYKNYHRLMNAKDFGIPQNRNRCFMVSILGDYFYTFPRTRELKYRLKDFLDRHVDEKYYLSDATIEMFEKHTATQQAKGNGFRFEPADGSGVAKVISTRGDGRSTDNYIQEKNTMYEIRRAWAMPNSKTFAIKPIKELVEKYVTKARVIIDPFANDCKYGTITNDLNPEFNTTHHLDALEFLKIQESESADLVLYDPPYSLRQASECYKSFGKEKLSGTVTNMKYWAQCKDEIARILKPNGVVICCGWNSNGIGKNRGFETAEILIVAHGGGKNDTIITVENKIGAYNSGGGSFGITIGKSAAFQRGPLPNISRTIDTNGTNGVILCTNQDANK